jgi:hypothetical protein
MVLMTVEAFEWIVLLTMADCATDNEIVPVKIVRTIFMTMDNGAIGLALRRNSANKYLT